MKKRQLSLYEQRLRLRVYECPMPRLQKQMTLKNQLTQDAEYHLRIRKLAHELRTPLSVIRMGLQLLQSVRNDDEQFETVHRFMESAGKELTQLIDAMAAESGNYSTDK